MYKFKLFVAFASVILLGLQARAQSACPLTDLTSQQEDAIDKIMEPDLNQLKSTAQPGPIQDAVHNCVTQVSNAIAATKYNIASVDGPEGAGGQLCLFQSTLSSKGAAQNTAQLKTISQQAAIGYAGAETTVEGKFGDTAADGPTANDICTVYCQTRIQNGIKAANQQAQANGQTPPVISTSVTSLYGDCEKTKSQVYKMFSSKITVAQGMATSSGSTSMALEIGGGVAGAAALGVAVSKLTGHSSSSSSSQANNGQVLVNGQWVDCTQTTNYTSTQCQTPLMNYCSQSANANSAGCSNFNSYYCGTPGTSTGGVSGASISYCQASSARSYCGNAVSTTAGLTVAASSANTLTSSPACQWLSGMSPTCAGSPTYNGTMSTIQTTNSSCLAPAALLSGCTSFASDPLCAAYNSGAVVTQLPPVTPGSAPQTTAAVATGTQATAANSALPPDAGGGATTTSTTSASTTSASTLGGFTGTSQAAVSRSLFSQTSSALSSVCASGNSNLIGCPHR